MIDYIPLLLLTNLTSLPPNLIEMVADEEPGTSDEETTTMPRVRTPDEDASRALLDLLADQSRTALEQAATQNTRVLDLVAQQNRLLQEIKNKLDEAPTRREWTGLLIAFGLVALAMFFTGLNLVAGNAAVHPADLVPLLRP